MTIFGDQVKEYVIWWLQYFWVIKRRQSSKRIRLRILSRSVLWHIMGINSWSNMIWYDNLGWITCTRWCWDSKNIVEIRISTWEVRNFNLTWDLNFKKVEVRHFVIQTYIRCYRLKNEIMTSERSINSRS